MSTFQIKFKCFHKFHRYLEIHNTCPTNICHLWPILWLRDQRQIKTFSIFKYSSFHPFWKIIQSPQSWIHKVNYFSGSNPNLIKFFDCFSEHNREFSIWNSNNSKSVERWCLRVTLLVNLAIWYWVEGWFYYHFDELWTLCINMEWKLKVHKEKLWRFLWIF